MVQASQILEFVDGIVAKFKPQRVILFGSYAYGQPTEDSDVDLLVVKEFRGSNYELMLDIRGEVPARFGFDLLVHRPGDIVRRIRDGDFFLDEVMSKGLVIYDRDAGMGAEGRRRLHGRFRAAAVA